MVRCLGSPGARLRRSPGSWRQLRMALLSVSGIGLGALCIAPLTLRARKVVYFPLPVYRTVTEISGSCKTFCHDINTFAGSSGAWYSCWTCCRMIFRTFRRSFTCRCAYSRARCEQQHWIPVELIRGPDRYRRTTSRIPAMEDNLKSLFSSTAATHCFLWLVASCRQYTCFSISATIEWLIEILCRLALYLSPQAAE